MVIPGVGGDEKAGGCLSSRHSGRDYCLSGNQTNRGNISDPVPDHGTSWAGWAQRATLRWTTDPTQTRSIRCLNTSVQEEMEWLAAVNDDGPMLKS